MANCAKYAYFKAIGTVDKGMHAAGCQRGTKGLDCDCLALGACSIVILTF